MQADGSDIAQPLERSSSSSRLPDFRQVAMSSQFSQNFHRLGAPPRLRPFTQFEKAIEGVDAAVMDRWNLPKVHYSGLCLAERILRL